MSSIYTKIVLFEFSFDTSSLTCLELSKLSIVSGIGFDKPHSLFVLECDYCFEFCTHVVLMPLTSILFIKYGFKIMYCFLCVLYADIIKFFVVTGCTGG